MFDILENIKDTIEPFNTFIVYPFATIAHWAVGIFCGIELELAKIHKNVSQAILAAVVFSGGWVVYETVEYLTEHDDPSRDIANGLIFLVIGILLTHVKHRHILRYLDWRRKVNHK